jgi:hypothetical protein
MQQAKWHLQLGGRSVAQAVPHAVDLRFNLLGRVVVFCLNGSFLPQFKFCNAATNLFQLLNRIPQRFGGIIVLVCDGTLLGCIKLADVLQAS